MQLNPLRLLLSKAGAWTTKHPKLYSAALAAVFSLGVFTGLLVYETVDNYRALRDAGQLYSVEVPAYDKNPAEQAAKTGKLRIAVYNINFNPEDTTSYEDGLEDYLDKVFAGKVFPGLGIDIEMVSYRDVYPKSDSRNQMLGLYTEEELEDPEISEELEAYPKEFEEFVRSIALTGRPAAGNNNLNSNEKLASENLPAIDEYLKGILGAENIHVSPNAVDFGNDNPIIADIGVIIADFKDSGAGEVACINDEASVRGPYVLIDKRYGNEEPKDEHRIRRDAAHGLGHEIGLDHSIWPIDIMSYASSSSLSGLIIENIPWFAIGPETWLEGRHIKKEQLEKAAANR